MDSTKFWRQLDIINLEKLQIPITVVGAGAIGSFTTLALAKMGCNDITSYDIDCIEEHNLPNQFYKNLDIGKKKVDALRDIVKEFSDCNLKVNNEKFVKQKLQGIVISTVDSMKSRKDIFNSCKYDPNVKLFIDTRMGAEVMKIYTIIPYDPDQIKYFEKTLHSDEEAEQVRCTEKTIIYNVLVESGFIVSQVKKWIMNQEYKKELIFDVKNLILLQD